MAPQHRRTLWLALLIALAATNQAAIDKDEGKFSHNLTTSSSPDQHNVINLSLHTELPAPRESSSSFDLSRTRRLRDALNVFDLALLGAKWGQVETEGGIAANCSRDMRSYLAGLSDAKMWAVKSESKKN